MSDGFTISEAWGMVGEIPDLLERGGHYIQADALRALIGEQTKEYHFREQTNFPNLPHPVACQCFKCRTKPAKTHSQPDAWRFPGA